MFKCLRCGKEILNKRNKFCSKSCATIYNNYRRKKTTKGRTKKSNCIICNKEIEVSIHINRNRVKCEDCKKHNRPHSKKVKNLLDCSKRTITKILKRANIGCSICGWNESTCDIHHIIPKSKNGVDDNSNLIVVCPNCHRVCHTTNKYNIDFLQNLSIDKIFPNWNEFYHQKN